MTLRADQQAQLHEREIETALAGASSYVLARLVEKRRPRPPGRDGPRDALPLQLVEQYFRSRERGRNRASKLCWRKAADLFAEDEPTEAAPGGTGARR